jgi:hypothetical protein
MHSLEKLQENNVHVIFAIPAKELRRVSENVFSSCETYLRAEGRHFETPL